MKCPNCHGNMMYVNNGNAHCSFKCPQCGYEIGNDSDPKKDESKEEEKK